MSHRRRLVDLSHTIRDGLITYKGIPGPIVCDFLSREASRQHYEGGTEFHIARIDMVANTGTYLDCPFHRFADGEDLSEMGLERCADLPAVLVRVNYRERLETSAEDFRGLDVRGKAVLVHTGWCRHWDTPDYFDGHPYLSEEAAVLLRDSGAVLVGIDSYNIDDTRTRNSRPVHTVLLGSRIPIVEHLRGLEQLPATGFAFSAVPPKIAGMGTFPVRAFARLELSFQRESMQATEALGSFAIIPCGGMAASNDRARFAGPSSSALDSRLLSCGVPHVMFETVERESRESCRDFKYAELRMRDGSSLGIYESGPDNAPPVVLVNPIGAPILLASRLMSSLADSYRVICWEQRGCNSDLETFTRKPHDFAAFVDDLVDVVDHIGGGPCGLIGICSGASVVIRAVAKGWVPAAPLILVSPLVRFARGYVPSLFDRAVVPYMQMIGSGNRALAKDLMDLEAAKPAEQNGGTEEEVLMEAAARWSMRSLESLLVYARAVQAFSAPRLETEFSQIDQRAWVFAAADDSMITIQSVRSLVQQLPRAHLTEYPQGGHLIVATSKQLHGAIRDCLDAAHRT